MTYTTAVRRWLGDDDGVYECRNCGTNLKPTDWHCPSCGSAEIAEYDEFALQ